MCFNCACENPHDDMGNPSNITEQTFKESAEAWGQTVKEAKLNTLKLLMKEFKVSPKEQPRLEKS
jgi:hypothetical protein